MKNSASEIYVFDHATAYQHAFGYIRQLAILLRNSMKVKTKVCMNAQYLGTVDFQLVYRKRTNKFIIGNTFIASTFGVSF